MWWWRSLLGIGRPNPWWKHFPHTESRSPRDPTTVDQPALQAGDVVRLKLKPDIARRVIKVQWHAHRYEYVYVIETSARSPFEPYWFLGQLKKEPPA